MFFVKSTHKKYTLALEFSSYLIHVQTCLFSSIWASLSVLVVTLFHSASLCRRSLASSNLKTRSPTGSWIPSGPSGSRSFVVPAASAATAWCWTRVTSQRPGPAWLIRSWSSTLFLGPRCKHSGHCLHATNVGFAKSSPLFKSEFLLLGGVSGQWNIQLQCHRQSQISGEKASSGEGA